MSLNDANNFGAIKVQEFISEVFAEHSGRDWSDLTEIAKLTALRQEKNGQFYISNFWRGPMLYSLVRAIKPRRILELGTGRGYGAFCMAKAMEDGGIDGKLFTVDRTPSNKAYDWAYVDASGENTIENISLDQFWKRHLPESLNARIEFKQGDTAASHELLSNEKEAVDLVFIDSDHTYNGVTLDFFSTHSIAASNAVFVFDDYSAARGYGIRKLINEELSDFYSLKVIDMELTEAHDIAVDHMMAVCNVEAAEVNAEFTSPSDLRFKYLLARRWLRSQAISLVRLLRRR